MMTTEPDTSPPLPRSIVYQNPDFVSAMLQELFQIGLVESADNDYTATSTESTNTDTTGGGKATVSGSVPGIARGELSGSGERIHHQAHQDENVTAARKRFVFSEPFYLDAVRRELAVRGQITTVERDNAGSIAPGDIAEFTASFRPNEVNALLDIATPELVGEIARYVVRTGTRAKINDRVQEAANAGVDMDATQIAAQRALGEAEASDKASLATAVAHALKVDTRGEASKEFHATITPKLSAVVMCDTAHFVTADPDRLLDGTFVVLGKVIQGLTGSTPILSKNKLLHRIQPDAVAELLTTLVSSDDDDEGGGMSDYVDLSFPPEITNAITVMPIAIYI